MRKIIFKGYNPDHDKWITSSNITQHSDGVVKLFDKETRRLTEVDPYSLAEFTGRYDTNQKKIFEYDVVKVNPTHWGSRGVEYGVIFMDGTILMHGLRYHLPDGGLTVIGPVYENAHLLSAENFICLKAHGVLEDEEDWDSWEIYNILKDEEDWEVE